MPESLFISSVEIQGFKSIRAPISLRLDQAQLLGIVGPNGSGKSNILDALCFALAPTTPLRVNVLSELRHLSGTQKCSVTVRFSNSDVLQVELTHQQNRVYSLNGRLKTAQSVKEFLRGRGLLLSDRLSILQQSHVTKLADKNSSQAIGAVIKTASGVDRWRAEVKGKEHEGEEMRIAVRELTAKIRGLEIEASKSADAFKEDQQYEETASQYSQLGRRFVLESTRLLEQLDEQIARIEQVRLATEESQCVVNGKLGQIAAAKQAHWQKYRETESELESTKLERNKRLCLQQELKNHIAELESLNGETTQNQIEQEINKQRGELLQIVEKRKLNEDRLGRLLRLQHEMDGRIASVEETPLSSLTKSIQNLEDEVEALRTQRTSLEETRLKEQDMDAMRERVQKLDDALVKNAFLDKTEALKRVCQRIDASESQRCQIENQLQQAKEHWRRYETCLSKRFGRATEIMSPLYTNFSFKQHGPEIEKFLHALHLIMGSSVGVWIVPSIKNAKRAVDAASSIASVNKTNPSKLWFMDQLIASEPSFMQHLRNQFSSDELFLPMSFFNYDVKLHKAMVKCVGAKVIVKDKSVAERVLKIAPYAICVTIGGVIRKKGSLVGGWTPALDEQSCTPIKLKYSMNKAAEHVRQQTELLDSVKSVLNTGQREREMLLEDLDTLREMENEKQKLVKDLKHAEATSEEIRCLETRIFHVEGELAKLRDICSSMHSEQKESVCTTLESDINSIKEQMERDDDQTARIEGQLKESMEELKRAKGRDDKRLELQSRKNSIEDELKALGQKLDADTVSAEAKNVIRGQNNLEIEQLEDREQKLQVQLGELETRLMKLLKEKDKAQGKRKQVENVVQAVERMDKSLFSKARQLGSGEDRTDDLNNGVAGSLQELKKMKGQLAILIAEIQADDLDETQLARLRNYPKIKQDVASLQQKLEILQSEMEVLERATPACEDEVIAEHQRVFQKISTLFEQHCAHLLPQMNIWLECVDETDPSKGVRFQFSSKTTGGRGNFNSEQLSGGQRTLISLVLLISAASVGGFAKTLLFDEVDASLDVSNQERLGKLLKSLCSDGYQVICISHNPIFHKACDKLIKAKRFLIEPSTFQV